MRGVGPFRLNRDLQEREVQDHRFLFCVSYTACLDVAAKRWWKSFTCRGCVMWGDPDALDMDEAERMCSDAMYKRIRVTDDRYGREPEGVEGD